MREEINRISLTNKGGFVCSINFVYIDDQGQTHEVKGTGNFPVLQTRDLSPGEVGVPPDMQVALKVGVVAGHDAQGKYFTFNPACSKTAYYTISGTTLDNTLEYEGIR